jgi:hypothetical protein
MEGGGVAEEDDVEFVVAFDAEAGGGADVGEGSEALTLRDQMLLAKDPVVLRTKNFSREDWVALGRRLGEDEAVGRREEGAERADRVRRAGEYAGWEWNGKPARSATGKRVFRSYPKKLSKDD